MDHRLQVKFKTIKFLEDNVKRIGHICKAEVFKAIKLLCVIL